MSRFARLLVALLVCGVISISDFAVGQQEPMPTESSHQGAVHRHGQGHHGQGHHGRGPHGRGQGGQGRGRGAGQGEAMRQDRDVFHYLLDHHQQIRRTVTPLDNGVQTVTESDDPQVVEKIQEHVAAMHRRVEEGRGLRYWDELFAALFQQASKIKMDVENTDHGVRVRETSDDPTVVKLIQAHAKVVSAFVDRGFDEAHENHPVPSGQEGAGKKTAAKSEGLAYPIIADYGGVVVRSTAAEQPRVGAKVVFDATADATPEAVNKAFERAARLLNLYGAAGLKAEDVQVTIVVHGETTKAVLNDAAYQSRFGVEKNPNLPLIARLREAGVEFRVCGQALSAKGFADNEVADDVAIAVSALTAVMNKQADGYGCVLVP